MYTHKMIFKNPEGVAQGVMNIIDNGREERTNLYHGSLTDQRFKNDILLIAMVI